MKIVGLITEYNPFHNGHIYHIRQAKALTGADAVIVVMSGDFVQRGTPALLPKRLRTACALSCGVSLVIELPVCYSTGSAEAFATGAVSLLDRLGCVDALCFGSECGDLTPLKEAADLLAEEPAAYRAALQSGLRQGMSFPAAREQALTSCGIPGEILSSPNNILGVEYLKAIRKQKSSLQAYTIPRAGAGFHDLSVNEPFSSASALRAQLAAAPDRSRTALLRQLDGIAGQMPEPCTAILRDACGLRFPVYADDFSLLLKAALLRENAGSLRAYADVGGDLANRIQNHRDQLLTFTGFCEALKNRSLTYSRISRALLHILLGIRIQDLTDFRAEGISCYARILGFAKKNAALFSLLKNRSQIPLITRLSQTGPLTETGKRMLELDLYAADLYESVVADRYRTPFQNERLQQIIKL